MSKKRILDRAFGEALKIIGMEKVQKGADLAWRSAAAIAIRLVAEKNRFFTSDDVWATGLPRPREPRALGPELMSIARDGVIVATKKFKLTAQASRHRAPIRIWRSCVWRRKKR